MFQENFKGVSSQFQGCVKSVLKVLLLRCKGVSKKFLGSFKEVLKVFKGISLKLYRVFQGPIEGLFSRSLPAWQRLS